MGRRAGRGENTRPGIVLVGGPSTQATALAASMAYSSNTASPMSRGGGHARVATGVEGLGIASGARFCDEINPPTGDPSARAIAPVAVAVGAAYGFGGGPSNPPAYPSTGVEADFGATGGLDLGKLANLGMGG